MVFLFQSSDKQKRSKTVSIFKTGSTVKRYNLQLCFLMWVMNLIFNIKLIFFIHRNQNVKKSTQ